MSEIPSVGPRPISTVQRVSSNGTAPTSEPVSAANGIAEHGDRVELSERAQMMERLRRSSGVRQDVVDRVRAEIDQGSYETPERLEVAIDRLLDDLTG